MIKSNYHTHTFYCGHAGGTVREYVLMALNHNFDILGFSEHAPVAFIKERMSMEAFECYLDDINRCKTEFKGQICLLKGLEIEYMENNIEYIKNLKEKLDYLIFGAHFYTDLGNMLENNTYKITSPEQIELYGEYVVRAIKSGLFDLIAHPDLYMFNYPSFDNECKKIAHMICKAAEEYKVPLEVNANGIRRGKRKRLDGEYYMYPCDQFWQIAQEYDIEVIISADCHSVPALDDEAIKIAYSFAREHNLKIIDKLKLKGE